MKSDADQFVDELNLWHARTIAQKTVEALRKNHFDAGFLESMDEAIEIVLQFIKPGMSVGFGGSQTIRQSGLKEKLIEMGCEILDHNDASLNPEQKMQVMRRQQICDVFLCSSNAITVQGELYNVDGNGNRIAAMTFGPSRVIVLAGVNKLCTDENQAWERIKSKAAPINLKRLNRPNPCTREGYCCDCNLPTRGCNAYLILRKKPSLTDFSVFIVNQALGF